MYVVIFKASIKQLDASYEQLAERLRERALASFGCIRFDAYTENDRELALSYWPNLESIRNWKQDAMHLAAQHQAHDWYTRYGIEIAKLERSYGELALALTESRG